MVLEPIAALSYGHPVSSEVERNIVLDVEQILKRRQEVYVFRKSSTNSSVFLDKTVNFFLLLRGIQ